MSSSQTNNNPITSPFPQTFEEAFQDYKKTISVNQSELMFMYPKLHALSRELSKSLEIVQGLMADIKQHYPQNKAAIKQFEAQIPSKIDSEQSERGMVAEFTFNPRNSQDVITSERKVELGGKKGGEAGNSGFSKLELRQATEFNS